MDSTLKKSVIAVVLILTMTVATFSINTPLAQAADIPTWMFLTVQPDPIGVGQTANIVYWLDKAPPTAAGPRGDRWQNWKLEITSPDEKTETRNLGISDAAGSGYLAFTPTQIGNYTLKVTFPGQNITQGTTTNWYKSSESAIVQLSVQQEQIAAWPYNPLTYRLLVTTN